VSVIDVYCRKW